MMEERNYEVLLWIEAKDGREHTEYDEDEQPHTHMVWKHRIITKRSTAFNLRKDIEKNNDGDYDFSVRVLYVTTLNGDVLIDYVNHPYIHVHDYLDESKRDNYNERLSNINKDEKRKQEEILKRIESFPDYEIGGR